MRTDWSQARLTELDISYCYGIAESGLMEMLPKLIGVRYLQLSFCGWGRALTDKVMNAMSQTKYERLETLDIHSSFNITGEMLCKFVKNCSGLTTLCVGSAINSNEDLEALLKGLHNLKNFYVTKQASIKTETVFDCVKRFCRNIETLALYNFYAVNRCRVEESLVELVSACRFLKVLCIRGTNVPLRTELTNLATKVKNVAKRTDIEISRRPHFLLTGAKLCLDSVVKKSAFLWSSHILSQFFLNAVKHIKLAAGMPTNGNCNAEQSRFDRHNSRLPCILAVHDLGIHVTWLRGKSRRTC